MLRFFSRSSIILPFFHSLLEFRNFRVNMYYIFHFRKQIPIFEGTNVPNFTLLQVQTKSSLTTVLIFYSRYTLLIYLKLQSMYITSSVKIIKDLKKQYFFYTVFKHDTYRNAAQIWRQRHDVSRVWHWLSVICHGTHCAQTQ